MLFCGNGGEQEQNLEDDSLAVGKSEKNMENVSLSKDPGSSRKKKETGWIFLFLYFCSLKGILFRNVIETRNTSPAFSILLFSTAGSHGSKFIRYQFTSSQQT